MAGVRGHTILKQAEGIYNCVVDKRTDGEQPINGGWAARLLLNLIRIRFATQTKDTVRLWEAMVAS